MHLLRSSRISLHFQHSPRNRLSAVLCSKRSDRSFFPPSRSVGRASFPPPHSAPLLPYAGGYTLPPAALGSLSSNRAGAGPTFPCACGFQHRNPPRRRVPPWPSAHHHRRTTRDRVWAAAPTMRAPASEAPRRTPSSLPAVGPASGLCRAPPADPRYGKRPSPPPTPPSTPAPAPTPRCPQCPPATWNLARFRGPLSLS